MKAWVTALLVALALAGCNFSFDTGGKQEALPDTSAGTPELQQAADAGARAYLRLIDAGKDDEVWATAGNGLHETTSKLVFSSALKMARATTLPDKREVAGYEFTPKIDARLPKGDYVVVEYRSVAGNVSVVENVVLQHEAGAWKLIGYHFNKRATLGGE
ncbi:DUF4019 domain-containing protein [Pseudoxanthomonas sp. Root630]|uniref:DUF4019 domain-containing protein n=1 Tax=Pseudoxanthomonas sp. Root630 TaxID=1736574 RepID=UPI00070385D6|nr:DUF4019 domain-containing protein [Pseudoxanthomonas sp. Root630]KRA51833.1 hypothetical protein ASD72_01735 [Pseudoxanthomonas sp. Root630]